MTKFYFDSREGSALVSDEEGRRFPNLEMAIANAVIEARSLMAEQLHGGTIDLDGAIYVTTQGGVRLASVSFGQAVTLIM